MCCRAKTCCGCCGLSVGVYIVAVFTMIIGGLWATSSGYYLNNVLQSGVTSARVIGPLTGTVLFYGFWVLSAIFLVIAGCKKVKGLLIPWMVVTGFILFLSGLMVVACILALALWSMFKASLEQFYNAWQKQAQPEQYDMITRYGQASDQASATIYVAVIILLVFFFLIFALWIYAMVVVCSFYSELRDEETPSSQGYQMTSSYEQPPAYTKDPYQRV